MDILAVEPDKLTSAAMVRFDLETGSARVVGSTEQRGGDLSWFWEQVGVDAWTHAVIGDKWRNGDNLESELRGLTQSVERQSPAGLPYPKYREIETAVRDLGLTTRQGASAVQQAVRFAVSAHGFKPQRP